MTIKHYRDLMVWQRALDLADKVFQASEKMPSSQRFILCAQMERAATSVVANIAEGRARHSEKDFIYHLNIAKGSLAELETLLMLAERRKFIDSENLSTLLLEAEAITKMLHGLKSKLRESADLRLAKT